jgi:putative ABC transport system permease protein
MNLLKLAWKNLTAKPLSMLLSLLLFALGTGLVALLLLLNQQLQEKFDKNLANIDLIIGAKGSPLQLVLCNMYHVDNPTGNVDIADIKPFLNPNHPLLAKAVPVSVGDSYKGYRIVGSTLDFPELYHAQLHEGRLWQSTMEVAIGATVAAKAQLHIGDTFLSAHGLVDAEEMLEMHRTDVRFKVVGIFAPTGSVLDQLILTNTQSIWAVHEHEAQETAAGHEHAHDASPLAHLDSITDLRQAPERQITALLLRFKGRNAQTLNMARGINENTKLQAASPAIELNRLYSMMGAGETLLRAIALVIMAVSGISIFISLYNSLKERRYELSLMRVMGASPRRLFLLIILEGTLLSLVGCAIGIALGHVGMELLAGVMESTYRYTFSGWVFLKEETYLLLAAMGIGLLAAVLPALQAFSMDISATLSEG